jgi:hypothetical protein
MIHTTRCTKLLSRAVYLFDSTPARKLLRFCSACVEEEAKTYGESFWHRSHQYQGVRVCHKHNTWLYATDKYRFKYYCNQLGTPNLDTVWGSRISLRSRNAYALHKVYSKIVHALLASDFGHIDRQSVSILYLSHINKVVEPENLYIENRGKFVSDLRTFFGSEFLEHINCHNSVGTYELWLSYFFSECDRFCHPVYHIIMLMFLGISVDRLAPLARIVEPVTENSSSHSETE